MGSVKKGNAIVMKDGQDYHATYLYVNNNVDIKGTVHILVNVYAK